MIMIEIYDSNNEKLGSFDNYNGLYLHISHQENMKLFDNHPEFGTIPWGFIIHSPERVALVNYNMKKNYDMKIIKEAFEKGLGLLEICKGDYQNLTLILLTPDVNIEELKKDWCKEYCDACGYRIIEIEK